MKNIYVGLCMIGILFLSAPILGDREQGSRIIEILIEEDFHQIGDLSSAEGPFLSRPFISLDICYEGRPRHICSS